MSTDYETMAAGAEMDRLIGEQVMGWLWVVHKPEISSAHPGERFLVSPATLEGLARYVNRATGEERCAPDPCRGLSPFSSDIAAAWEVVEALRERGLIVAITSPSPGLRNWDVRGWNEATNSGRFIGHGETAALAICRAALCATAPRGATGAREQASE